MGKKTESLIVKLFVVISVLLIGGTVYNSFINKTRNNFEIEYKYVDENVNIESLKKNNTFIPYHERKLAKQCDYTIVYVISTSNCSVCIKQYELFYRYFAENYNDKQFNHIIAVIDSNYAKALWYARINPLKMDALCVKNIVDKKLLITFEKTSNDLFERQLLIVDNQNNRIKCRIKINNGITTTLTEIMHQMPAILQGIYNNK